MKPTTVQVLNVSNMYNFSYSYYHYISDKTRPPSGTWATIRQIYYHHGIRGLFTGLVPRLIKVAPACAIMIATFEYSKVTIVRLANMSSSDKSILTGSIDHSGNAEQYSIKKSQKDML